MIQRVHIIGPGGSGKTSLAKALSARLGIPHVEMDDLYWQENWQESPVESFLENVEQALRGGSWVVDGNYRMARDTIWEKVDTVVWLDYPIGFVIWRLLRRSIRRAVSRELLWGRNRERLDRLFFSGDSLLFYTLRTFYPRRGRYLGWMKEAQTSGITFVRLRSPRATRQWLGEHIGERSEIK